MLPGVVAAVVDYQFHDTLAAAGFVAEAKPFYVSPTGKARAALVVTCVILWAWNRRRLRPGEHLIMLLSTLILWRMGRFSTVYAIGVAPQLAILLPRLSDRVIGRPLVRWAATAVLLAGITRVALAFPRSGTSIDDWLNRMGPDSGCYPCAAAAWVESEKNIRPETHRLISEFAWGGYLEWRLPGQFELFLDGRAQIFTPEFWKATYLAKPADRRRFLSGIRADAAIVPLHGGAFRDALLELGWVPRFRDAYAEVLVPPPTVAVATKKPSRFPFAVPWFPGPIQTIARAELRVVGAIARSVASRRRARWRCPGRPAQSWAAY